MYHDRINFSEGTDPAKSNNSKQYMVWQYSFFNRDFKFEDYVWNGCHDLTILCLNISDIAIITIKGVDYHSSIYDISKYEAIRLLENYVLDDLGYI